jgi:hypothetical protein
MSNPGQSHQIETAKRLVEMTRYLAHAAQDGGLPTPSYLFGLALLDLTQFLAAHAVAEVIEGDEKA